MKIRNGFVSNSSSTSYVVVIPADFDVDSIVYKNLDVLRQRYEEENRNEYPWRRAGEPKNKVILPFDYIQEYISAVKAAIKKGRIYQDDYRQFYKIRSFVEMIRDLIISRHEGGPDEGTIDFVKEENIRDKASKFNVKLGYDEREDIVRRIKEEEDEYRKIKAAKEVKIKERKDKIKGVDPYEEEEWADEDDDKKGKVKWWSKNKGMPEF